PRRPWSAAPRRGSGGWPTTARRSASWARAPCWRRSGRGERPAMGCGGPARRRTRLRRVGGPRLVIVPVVRAPDPAGPAAAAATVLLLNDLDRVRVTAVRLPARAIVV